jgi:crotonobetainyl-CoA hydratase
VSLLLPATDDDIRAALTRLRIAPLLAGYRGRPAASVDAILATVRAVQDHVAAHPGQIAELEINPLLCTPDRAVAADALIMKGDARMTEGPIRTERRGAVLEVTLDRPKANAIDLATSRIMGRVFTDFRDDPDLRVALLTAAGEKFFCPGWDLKAAAAGDAVDGDYGVGGFGGLQELRGLNKPVIVAVNGICCGGGLELALSGDIILAADHATFALPEIRSGTVADAASIKLPRRIPYHIAMEMLLTGRWIDAPEAARWGLVNRVLPAPDL